MFVIFSLKGAHRLHRHLFLLELFLQEREQILAEWPCQSARIAASRDERHTIKRGHK